MEKQAKAEEGKGVATGTVELRYCIYYTSSCWPRCELLLERGSGPIFPDYLIRSTLAGTVVLHSADVLAGPREDFWWPLERTGLCVVASIQRDKAPWNMTGWLRERRG
jgi:hypothetical protein